MPARYGDALMRASDGRRATQFGITPYGTEALGVMRIEKGHVAGNEINGTTTARDLGLGSMMSTQEGLHRPRHGRPPGAGRAGPAGAGRLQAGRPHGAAARRRAFHPDGAAPATADNDEGYMTSVAFSPTLGHWIGLGLLRAGPQRIGERVRAYDPVRGGDVEVEVCNPVFCRSRGDAAPWLASRPPTRFPTTASLAGRYGARHAHDRACDRGTNRHRVRECHRAATGKRAAPRTR